MIRIVKMSFDQASVNEFLNIFERSKPKIQSFPGCSSVNLLQDKTTPTILMTYSIWDNEEALNSYRNSAFFKETWQATKSLFNAKPEAWSLEEIA